MSDLGYTDADAPPADAPSDEPQWDLLAEQSTLGAMMLSRTAVDDVMEEITPGDFYLPKHEVIARAIGSMVARNEPVDVLTVAAALTGAKQLRHAGGAEYLHELTGTVATVANASYYAEIVKRLAVLRRLVVVGTHITQKGFASEGSLEDLVESARIELDGVMVSKRKSLRSIGESLSETIEELDTEPTYLPTPWTQLNELIGGLAPGNLMVIAARPGSGKTMALLQTCATLAHRGMVAFSSLEMTEAELQLRLLAQYGPVHMTALRNHKLSQDEWKRVAEARSRVLGAPIYIDETPGATVSQVRSHARAVARKGELVCVAVDYLQLVTGEGESRSLVVGTVARDLKNLAKQLNVPVVAAAQLKRAGGAGRKRELPTMDDLRESGDIENAADVVLLLDRDPKKNAEVTVIVEKNRHGETGKFQLEWQAEYSRLRDKRWSHTALIEESELK